MCSDQCDGKILDIRDDPKERLSLRKEVYVQTQNWARHNETLIIATNTVLLGAIAAIASNYFKNSGDYSVNILWLPLFVSATGVITTLYLSRQYKLSITRVLVYEKYFKMHDPCEKISEIAKDYSLSYAQRVGTFVPEYLCNPPKFGAISSWFFLLVHALIFVVSGFLLNKS